MFSKISTFFSSLGTSISTSIGTVWKMIDPRTVYHRTQMVNFNLAGTGYVLASLIASAVIFGKYELLVMAAAIVLWQLLLGLYQFIRRGDRTEFSNNSVVIMYINLITIQTLPTWFFYGALWYVFWGFVMMTKTMQVFSSVDLSDDKGGTITVTYDRRDPDTKEPTEVSQDPVK